VYFKTFIVCLLLHYLAVTIVKIVFARGFKSTHNLPGKVFHILNHLYCPSIYKDWDEDLLVCSDIEENWRRVKKEMKCLLFLFALENVFLCTPLFILSSTIAKRNLFLDEYFPQVLEESQATVLVYSLSVILASSFIILPFLQYFLFVMYNKFGHPWSKILNP